MPSFDEDIPNPMKSHRKFKFLPFFHPKMGLSIGTEEKEFIELLFT